MRRWPSDECYRSRQMSVQRSCLSAIASPVQCGRWSLECFSVVRNDVRWLGRCYWLEIDVQSRITRSWECLRWEEISDKKVVESSRSTKYQSPCQKREVLRSCLQKQLKVSMLWVAPGTLYFAPIGPGPKTTRFLRTCKVQPRPEILIK